MLFTVHVNAIQGMRRSGSCWPCQLRLGMQGDESLLEFARVMQWMWGFELSRSCDASWIQGSLFVLKWWERSACCCWLLLAEWSHGPVFLGLLGTSSRYGDSSCWSVKDWINWVVLAASNKRNLISHQHIKLIYINNIRQRKEQNPPGLSKYGSKLFGLLVIHIVQ